MSSCSVVHQCVVTESGSIPQSLLLRLWTQMMSPMQDASPIFIHSLVCHRDACVVSLSILTLMAAISITQLLVIHG